MYSRDCIALCVFSVFIVPSSATEPFAYTWIEKKHDKWEHLHGYLGGAAIVLEDVPNKKKERFWLKDLISESNFKRYVKESTAGPIWGENSLAYFITIENQRYFCIRLAWDERIIFNLDAFKPVTAGSLDAGILQSEEVKVFRERLENAVKMLALGIRK